MPRYRYHATNLNGRNISGVFEGTEPDAVASMLRRKDFYPLEITLIQEEKAYQRDIELNRRIDLHVLAVFCMQLSTILAAGVPLVPALEMLRQQTDNNKMARVVDAAAAAIPSGRSLSSVLSEHADRFPDIFIHMIEAGEATGDLDRVLSRLGHTFEREHKLNKKVRAALTYPGIVAAFAVLVVTALMVFIVPMFIDMYTGFGQALPLPTRALIAVSSFITQNWVVLIICILSLLWIAHLYLSTSQGRYQFDRFKLRMPVFGKLNLKVVAARFTRTLSTMLSAGVTLNVALEITARALGNAMAQKELLFASERIQSGQSLSATLSAMELFPPMVVNMVRMGEESGAIESLLAQTAEYFDDEAEAAMQQMATYIEPMIIVLLGGIILFAVLGLLMPMFSMYSFIGGA